ncbi:MAG: hypothetical protein GY941_16010, partial [Planctomycetes bacterium]|nr:hypothetical protein [Planctomycetota bacterium]
DHQGTPQKITNTAGTVKWSAVSDTFGNCSIDVEEIENNLRFAGQYYDSETGLHYNWNRYYDPETGRYMRVDPVGEGLNLYLYVQNNPLKYIDPEGLTTRSYQLPSIPTLDSTWGNVPANAVIGVGNDIIGVANQVSSEVQNAYILVTK